MLVERLTTRTRILWLVFASALPVILLSVYVALQQRTAAEARARDEIQHHAQLVASLLDRVHVDELPLVGTVELGRGEAITLFDRGNIVIARYPPRPGHSGKELPDRAALEAIAKAGGGVVEQRDGAGIVRLYALARATMNPDRAVSVRVLVSVPKSVIHEDIDRALTQTLFGIAAVTLLLIASAWYGAERLVLQPIRALLDMTAKVRAGDFAARTGMSASHEELSQLGSALDHMAEQLQVRDAKLRDMLEELRTQALTDPLTGLYNRRYFWDALMREVIAARRKPAVFSVILMDLDGFKNVNDTWGHDAGDVVLKEIADLLRASVRGSDIAARYGGEEFSLLLPETTGEVAEERAESLRRDLQALDIAYGSHRLRITASFGVAEYTGDMIDASALMKRVDAALYAAKQAGRNKVVAYRPACPGRSVSA